MFDAAFVVLRELAELLLILMAVRECLKRSGRTQLLGSAVLAVVVGCLLGWSTMALVVDGQQGVRVEAVVSILLGAATLWIASSMLSSERAIQERVEDTLASLLDSRQAVLAIVAYCGLAGLRESMEVFIFLRSAAALHEPADIALGIAMGLVTVAAACIAFRSIWGKLKLLTIYRISTVLLCFVSVKLILEGLIVLLTEVSAPGSSSMSALRGHDPIDVTHVALLVTLWPTWILLRRWWQESKS